MKETILFKKQRELGQIITDTFKFIRDTWKVLFGLIFRIVGPVLILLILLFAFYIKTMGGIATNPAAILTKEGSVDLSLGSLVGLLLLILICVPTYYGLLHGTIIESIKSYMKNEGVINKKEVIEGVKNNFWNLIGLGLMVGLIILTGFVFCVVPGIYLAVVLSTCYAVLIFEKRKVLDSISHCFTLIKGEFWITFATVLVIGLLYYFILSVFKAPAIFYTFFKVFTANETIGGDPSELFDIGYIILNAFSQLCQYLLYSIMAIACGFIYFNLNERKNFTGTIETIDSLGKRE